MDPSIGWYQPEQQGPAKDLWARIYYVCQQVNNMNVNDKNSEVKNSAPDFISLNGDNNGRNLAMNKNTTKYNENGYYNRTKRKRENLASTYDLNENKQFLIGQFGGCPWKNKQREYKKGIMG